MNKRNMPTDISFFSHFLKRNLAMHMIASQVISFADASVSQPLYLVFKQDRIKCKCSSNKV
jgi:hypothetical protein